MKKTLLTFLVLVSSMSLSAKEWPISFGFMHHYTIEVPDTYDCVYDGDTAKSDMHYVFALPGQEQFYLEAVEIAGISVPNVKTLPDTVLFPSLKEKTVLSSENQEDGLLSRIITVRENDKTTTRLYLYVVPDGLITIEAKSKTDDYTQLDEIARSVESHFQWIILLIIIGCGLGVAGLWYLLGSLVEKAWNYRKINRTKAWLYLLAFIVIAVALAFLGPLINVNYWIMLLVYLGFGITAGGCMINGYTIIAF